MKYNRSTLTVSVLDAVKRNARCVCPGTGLRVPSVASLRPLGSELASPGALHGDHGCRRCVGHHSVRQTCVPRTLLIT